MRRSTTMILAIAGVVLLCGTDAWSNEQNQENSDAAVAERSATESSESPTKATAPQWASDWSTGWKQAVEQKKPLVLFFKMRGCSHCVQMRDSTYRNPLVISQLDKSFVAVALSPEESAQLAKRMRIRLYPTTVVIAPENRIVAKVEGYASADNLRDKLSGALLEVRLAQKNAKSTVK